MHRPDAEAGGHPPFLKKILDVHHIRTNFIAKANYHAVLKDSQNNISEA